MSFTTMLTLLSMFGSLVSGVLALVAVLISVPVFLLRALGLMEATTGIELAKRQVRISRIRLIGAVLSANQWQPGRPLGPDEAALLTGELDLLFGEELADLRAAREERERGGLVGVVWENVVAVVNRRGWFSRGEVPGDAQDAEAASLAADFSELRLDDIPMEPMTGIVSRRPSAATEE